MHEGPTNLSRRPFPVKCVHPILWQMYASVHAVTCTRANGIVFAAVQEHQEQQDSYAPAVPRCTFVPLGSARTIRLFMRSGAIGRARCFVRITRINCAVSESCKRIRRCTCNKLFPVRRLYPLFLRRSKRFARRKDVNRKRRKIRSAFDILDKTFSYNDIRMLGVSTRRQSCHYYSKIIQRLRKQEVDRECVSSFPIFHHYLKFSQKFVAI